MIKTIKYSVLSIIILLSFIFIESNANAVDFTQNTRVDLHLPVLEIPNNAVTPTMSISQNGNVYVAWSDNWRGAKSIYVNTKFGRQDWLPNSTPVNTGFPKPTGSPEGNATLPQICSDNSGRVYIVWVDDRAVQATTGRRDIYFRYSKDFGATWNPEFVDERIDSDSPVVGDSINPQIACDENGNVYVVWEDDRNKPGTYEVYFRSLQVQFSKQVDYIVPYQHPEERLNTGEAAGRFSAGGQVISTDKNGHVYVAWHDNRNVPEDDIFNGIYFNVSDNHGATWLSEATRIDSASRGFYQSLYPAIRSDMAGNVYVAWRDDAGRAERGDKYAGDGTFDVYFNRSRDYGIRWNDNDTRIDEPAERIEVKHVAIANNESGVVSIVWASNLEATTKGKSTNYNIYYNHSINYGTSFLESEPNIRIDTGVLAGISNAETPRVQVNRVGNVFVAWRDKAASKFNIYFNFSLDKGSKDTWLDYDIQIDSSTPSGDSSNIEMSSDDLGNVYVVWQDDRSALAEGNYNIYFISGFLDIEALLLGGQRIGEACFIATAAYGSPYEHHVEILRDFRDRYLLSNSPGRWFVSAYYRLSPPLANFIHVHDSMRFMVRLALLPVVGAAKVSLYATPMEKSLLIFGIGLVMGIVYLLMVKVYRC